MAAYGRNRQSLADIEQELDNIFQRHPKSELNENDQPVIPAECLVDVFRAFSDVYNGVELMTNDELDLLKSLLAGNPGLAVTPQTLLQFIAARSKSSPHDSPHSSPNDSDKSLPERGRAEDRDGVHDAKSRSSSNESTGTSFYRSPGSRPPSNGPVHTPGSRSGQSAFDTSKRQRSTPLGNNAPSSWTKPPPAHRRRSDAGFSRSISDSESFSSSPSSFNGRSTSVRVRAPSNPTSPKHLSSSQPNLSYGFSRSRPPSRPHSRARSQPQNDHSGRRYNSPGSPSSPELEYNHRDESFMSSISSLPMPRSSSDSDSDEEEDDSTMLGLVLDRSAASSTVSMEPLDRLDALQKANADLGRKLMEAEKTLQGKLADHENELEEMQGRLEEAKSELSATKREEKELRAKERQNSTQISALESEIAKLQKSLDNARASYQSLQKQYQEQCAESERYRTALRSRDNDIKDYKDAAALQQLENQKWLRENDRYEERITVLEHNLSIAQAAQAQLDEQKQENLMLKETIDRMRFDMDEMRSNAVAGLNDKGGSSGVNSAANSMSKSLGAELLGKMGSSWEMVQEVEVDEEPRRSGEAEIEDEGEVTEGEDVVQTIITRKKRKVASRANRILTRRVEEVKEYSDAYTQHDIAEFTRSAVAQTNPPRKAVTSSTPTQTDEPKICKDAEAQTDLPSSGSASPDDVGTTASSSSTLLPPTPKPQMLHHLLSDLPPAYNQVAEQDIRKALIKDLHRGVSDPIGPLPSGISNDALEEWAALKDELGVQCDIINTIVTKSDKTGQPRTTTRKGGRFYNIYNTYVYSKDGATSFTPIAQVLMCLGASAMMFLYLTPHMVPHYAVPGGPTYYDRTAWSSFNSMQAGGEGFSTDGSAAVWSFLGTVGGGAARIVRGWPT